MENKINQTIIPPEVLQRVEKLKVYAILAGEKGPELDAMKDKLVMSLILAYNDSEALAGMKHMITNTGRSVELYQIPYMITKADIDKLIPSLNFQEPVMRSQVDSSPEDLIEAVERVFKLSGTASQRRVANAVINKYKKHAKFLPRIPAGIFDEAH